MTLRRDITAEEIRSEYDSGISLKEVRQRLGCSRKTLLRLMSDYNIPIRGMSTLVPQFQDPTWLREQIITLNRSYTSIAQELGSTSGNVAHHARRLGITEKRPQSEATRDALRRHFPRGRFGSNAANWKGGRQKSGNGYIKIYQPEHPAADPGGCVAEHRLVMEATLGRYLKTEEVVDHIDRNRSNNSPENLRLHESRAHHVKDHFSARDQLMIAIKKLARYEALYGPLDDED